MNNSRLIDVDSCIAGQSTKQGTVECPGPDEPGPAPRRPWVSPTVCRVVVGDDRRDLLRRVPQCDHYLDGANGVVEANRPRLPGPALREDVVVLAGARGALVP
jgi:hypothetical protein